MARTARVAAAAALLTAVVGCGFTVHMLNSHRALQTFASTPHNPAFMEDIYANIGSVFAGRCVRCPCVCGWREPRRGEGTRTFTAVAVLPPCFHSL